MTTGGGMKMLRGGTEIFSGIKGGAMKFLDILKGGGGSQNFSKFWSSRGLDSHQHLFLYFIYFTSTLS